MRAIKSSVHHLENIIYQRLIKMSKRLQAISIHQKHFWLTLMILGIVSQNAWAVGADGDTLGAPVTAAEVILSGSLMRLIVIAGSIFGVIKAYMASSPLLMGGSIAIGVGINLLMTWVKATWPILI
jgi:putative Mn2+ efflux pump MntP